LADEELQKSSEYSQYSESL